MNILLVCTANICRSAFAEVYANAHARNHGLPFTFTSAGTHGWDRAPMYPAMVEQLEARGIEAAAFRSRRLTAADLRGADVVLTMESAHRRFIVEEYPEFHPQTFPLGQFVRLHQATGAPLTGDLVTRLRAYRDRERTEDDVADPYERGADAAAACASRLIDLIHQLG